MSSAAGKGGNGAVDHISELNDDLLLHILRFLPDSRDVVCTSVLSTRWRDLWTRAPVLHVGNWNRNGRNAKANNARFNDFVHNVLAQRTHGGADADIDTLDLRTRLWPGKSRGNVWLRRAMRHTVTSFKFEVSEPSRRQRRKRRAKLRARLSLPGGTRLTTMSLELDYAILVLPPTVEFHALTDLTLCAISFSGDDGHRLGSLLSSPSCCPRLRKLKLSNLSGMEELRLDGAALETLHLELLPVSRLDVDAPRLSALHVESYFMFCRFDGNSSIAVRAPALETVVASLALGYMQLELQRHTIQLLQQCRPINGHVLCLHVPEEDTMREIPKLPGVTNLTLRFYSRNNNHYLGATVSSLLARCSNLEYLHLDNRIHLSGNPGCEEGCGDCGLRGSWKDEVISLEHLRKVKLGGFSGQEQCFLDMVQLLLVSAPALKRMIVTAKSSIEGWQRPALVLAESLESSLPRGRGRWTARYADDAAATSEYEWTPDFEICSS